MLKEKQTDYELTAQISSASGRLAFIEKLAGLGYWEMDLKERRFFCSDEVYKLIGASAQDMPKIKLKDIMPTADYQLFFKKLRRLKRTRGQNNWEIKLQSLGGKMLHCQVRAAFFCIRSQEILAGTIQDLSEFIETRNKLRRADKEKSYFLAQASHDLRQPLQALLLFLDLFDTSQLNDTQRDLFQKILKTTDNLKTLLNHVLDLSKLEYGGTEVCPKFFNIGVLLSDLSQEFQDIATSQNLEFEYLICNLMIYDDAFLIERVLRNLLSNAFKFAKSKVSICCEEKPLFILIKVCDDGVGINAEEQEAIFHEFYRGQNAHQSHLDGAGLGLAIVQKIVKLIHGEISLQSALGQGSCFTLKLRKKK